MNINDIKNDKRNYKKKLNIIEEATILDLSDITTDLNEANPIEVVEAMPLLEVGAECLTELVSLENDIKMGSVCSSHNSSCSSRSSNSTADADADADADDVDADDVEADADADEVESGESNDEDYEDIDSDSNESEEADIIAKIKKFPVQVIALEHCENTLDELMNENSISDTHWDSIVLQILFSLITFQNVFHLTHNDLHTNNVMYMETTQKFLYYKLNHIYYKVPTYGKLFKIIDFGRAIYKFRGQLLCSDSYHPDGDAATQYNCEPYFTDKKPRLEPNYSFDLCRLGCALYDYLVDEPKSKIKEIILDWIKDDKGRNILYKKNGEERYPDFKLYKMIARTVNKHVPVNVLSNAYFDKFIISKKEITAGMKLMDIDIIPSYVL